MSLTDDDGQTSGSASEIVADTASGYHVLKISGYSRTKATPTGEFLKSRPFYVGGRRWHLDYYPNGDKSENADWISMILRLDDALEKEAKAQCQICFVDEAKNPALFLSVAAVTIPARGGWGRFRFIKREDLEKSKYLKDDSFTVCCNIVLINDFRAVDNEPPVFVSVPPSNLHRHFGDLIQTEKGADVVFHVGSERFAAHRCVLAARSPVFSAELFGSMKESDTAEAIRIDDMEAQVFKALLHFVYTDSLPKTKREEENVISQHLLVAADRYNLERMKLILEDKLCKYIEVGTLATILALAEQHQCHGLKKACFHFLSSPGNLRAVVATDGYKSLKTSYPAIVEELLVMLSNLV
ncbi:hypothetical protein EJB05_22273, partial [Eragrostis curvula]